MKYHEFIFGLAEVQFHRQVTVQLVVTAFPPATVGCVQWLRVPGGDSQGLDPLAVPQCALQSIVRMKGRYRLTGLVVPTYRCGMTRARLGS